MPIARSPHRKLATGLSALLIAVAGLALRPAMAEAQDCVPQSSPTVHAGDTVNVVATLSTTDPNENGEGETLVVQSTGSFSVTVSTYVVPQSFTFTATIDGETVSGTLTSSDGDETCTLSVTVNPKQRLSQKQKDALAKLGDVLDIASDGLGAVSEDCSGLGDPRLVELCEAFAVPLSAISSFFALNIQALALDPSDSNYMVIATPVIPSLPPLSPQLGATPQVAAGYNALVQNEEEMIGFGAVIYTCLNRAQGAADAGSALWESRQMAAAAQYENQLGAFLNAERSLRANLQAALQASGFPAVTPQPSDVLSFEQSVAANGLPSNIVSTLQQLGASADDIAQITSVAVVQDTNAAAQSFPASLTDPTVSADLAAAGQALQAPSPCLGDPSKLCIDDQPGDGRFVITVAYAAPNQSGNGTAIPLKSLGVGQGGLFWFFQAANPEMLIKVINACSFSNTFWVFYAAGTNVGLTITVTDTKTQRMKQYTNPPNTAAPPVQDTSAFACMNGDVPPHRQRVVSVAPGESADGVASREVPRLITSAGSGAAVNFPPTAVGSSSTEACEGECFSSSPGANNCGGSGTLTLDLAPVSPFSLTNLRVATGTSCNGTPVGGFPVSLSPGQVLRMDFVFSPTHIGSFTDTVTISGLDWNLSGSTPPTGGGSCVPSSTTLCIDNQPGDGRFSISVSFQSSNQSGNGTAIALAPLGVSEGGLFWFFSSTNPEMLVKIINACSLSNTFWFFESAGTNVAFTITLTDTQTRQTRTYTNALNTAAPPIQDTSALPCP
jgi:hypothetical protein